MRRKKEGSDIQAAIGLLIILPVVLVVLQSLSQGVDTWQASILNTSSIKTSEPLRIFDSEKRLTESSELTSIDWGFTLSWRIS